MTKATHERYVTNVTLNKCDVRTMFDGKDWYIVLVLEAGHGGTARRRRALHERWAKRLRALMNRLATLEGDDLS